MSQPATPGRRQLLAAWVAWVVVAVLTVALMVASVPIMFERFSSVCLDAASVCVERSEVPPEALGALRGAGVSLGAYAAFTVGVEILCKLVWISVGVLVFVFRSQDRMALLVSFFLLTFGTATLLTNGTEAVAAVHPVWRAARGLQVTEKSSPCCFCLPSLMAGSSALDTRRRGRVSPVPDSHDLFPGLYTSGPGFLDTAQVLVFFGAVSMLALQVYRYRYVSGPDQRRQTRWVVFGTTLAITILILVYGSIFFLVPGTSEDSPLLLLLVGSLIPFLMLLIPLSVSVAIFRSGLFDIDLVINRTLVYGSLTVTLLALYFGGIVVLQRVFVLSLVSNLPWRWWPRP